jgi:hypothetical protein
MEERGKEKGVTREHVNRSTGPAEGGVAGQNPKTTAAAMWIGSADSTFVFVGQMCSAPSEALAPPSAPTPPLATATLATALAGCLAPVASLGRGRG